ncbi:MAG TPA: hypothetical protein PKL31_11130 [Fulvivirga sp.]|nr:hypothetical protein [Fulvivirga sp.]
MSEKNRMKEVYNLRELDAIQEQNKKFSKGENNVMEDINQEKVIKPSYTSENKKNVNDAKSQAKTGSKNGLNDDLLDFKIIGTWNMKLVYAEEYVTLYKVGSDYFLRYPELELNNRWRDQKVSKVTNNKYKLINSSLNEYYVITGKNELQYYYQNELQSGIGTKIEDNPVIE